MRNLHILVVFLILIITSQTQAQIEVNIFIFRNEWEFLILIPENPDQLSIQDMRLDFGDGRLYSLSEYTAFNNYFNNPAITPFCLRLYDTRYAQPIQIDCQLQEGKNLSRENAPSSNFWWDRQNVQIRSFTVLNSNGDRVTSCTTSDNGCSFLYPVQPPPTALPSATQSATPIATASLPAATLTEPVPTSTIEVDIDDDGLVDNSDDCPAIRGIRSTRGCLPTDMLTISGMTVAIDPRPVEGSDWALWPYGDLEYWHERVQDNEEIREFSIHLGDLPASTPFFDATENQPDEPLNQAAIDWFMADAYCRWAGKRLPTLEELEQATSIPEFDFEPEIIEWTSTPYIHAGGNPEKPLYYMLWDKNQNLWMFDLFEHEGIEGLVVDSTRMFPIGFRCAFDLLL